MSLLNKGLALPHIATHLTPISTPNQLSLFSYATFISSHLLTY